MKPLVYVAGPYSQPDPIRNIRTALDVAGALIDTGLFTPIVPHLTGMWDLVQPRGYEEWLAYDFEIIERCDALYRIPGVSAGADREVAYASDLDIPVFETGDLTAMRSWARGWIADHTPFEAAS